MKTVKKMPIFGLIWKKKGEFLSIKFESTAETNENRRISIILIYDMYNFYRKYGEYPWDHKSGMYV